MQKDKLKEMPQLGDTDLKDMSYSPMETQKDKTKPTTGSHSMFYK